MIIAYVTVYRNKIASNRRCYGFGRGNNTESHANWAGVHRPAKVHVGIPSV